LVDDSRNGEGGGPPRNHAGKKTAAKTFLSGVEYLEIFRLEKKRVGGKEAKKRTKLKRGADEWKKNARLEVRNTTRGSDAMRGGGRDTNDRY